MLALILKYVISKVILKEAGTNLIFGMLTGTTGSYLSLLPTSDNRNI